MKVVFLHSELMPNTVIVFHALVSVFGAEVHVVYWDHKKRTPYFPENSAGVHYYRRSEFDAAAISKLLKVLRPDAVYVAGWMDAAYLRAVVAPRRQGVPVIVGFDDWWKGSLRQWVGKAIFPVLRKLLFSHAWIAGQRQYEFAKRLGFHDDAIVPNLLSCDTELFDRAFSSLPAKLHDYPKTFLYAGRFSPEKGIMVLAAAFEKYRLEYGGTWKLICVGNGPLENELTGRTNVDIRPFSSQSDLVEMMRKTGVFVLASDRDFSGLIVHEAACAGLPMILSSNVGSIPLFLIDRYNGHVFKAGSADELARAMADMANRSADELVLMGERSHRLSRRIDAEISAASFVSTIPRGSTSR